jgi:2-amino-4-hydroxy-6-hydroxymethyldihydropteridine diphosphokinase
MENQVVVSIGSNINREKNLPAAVELLKSHAHLLAVSPIYETVPVGLFNQPNFFNAAALVETHLNAADFKRLVLAGIENSLGRVRSADKNAPRTIDLDITLFNQDILNLDENHHIPDPDLLKFPHVAVPVADLVPDLLHPETGEPIAAIAARLLQNTEQDLLWKREDLTLYSSGSGVS